MFGFFYAIAGLFSSIKDSAKEGQWKEKYGDIFTDEERGTYRDSKGRERLISTGEIVYEYKDEYGNIWLAKYGSKDIKKIKLIKSASPNLAGSSVIKVQENYSCRSERTRDRKRPSGTLYKDKITGEIYVTRDLNRALCFLDQVKYFPNDFEAYMAITGDHMFVRPTDYYIGLNRARKNTGKPFLTDEEMMEYINDANEKLSKKREDAVKNPKYKDYDFNGNSIGYNDYYYDSYWLNSSESKHTSEYIGGGEL